MSTDVPALIFAQAPAAPETFNLLAYGPPGSGKTTAAASLHPLGKILWVNAEGAGALAYARKVAGNENILEVRIDQRDGFDAVSTLREVIRHIRSGNDPRPATVVIDTLGKVREALIRQLVVPGAKNSLQQFGEVAKTLGATIQVLRDEPVNLILLAHEQIEDADGERIVRPLIGGALTNTIPGEVDVMTYTSRVNTDDGEQFLGQLVDARGRRTKDRSGMLGPFRPLDFAEWLTDYRKALAVNDPELPFDPEPAADDTAAQETLAA